jgi:hypothetical protein
MTCEKQLCLSSIHIDLTIYPVVFYRSPMLHERVDLMACHDEVIEYPHFYQA